MAAGEPQRQPRGDFGERDQERERLLDAVAKAAGEQGYDQVSVERVVRHAGVPPSVFAEHFESEEQALTAAQGSYLDRLWSEAVLACEEGDDPWPLRVRSAMAAVLASVVEASALARAFIVEAGASSLAAAERQVAAVDRFAALLSEGRSLYPDAGSLPASTERMLVGGVASIVSGCLLAEDPQALLALESQLVEMVLIPYVGVEEARRVASP